MPEISREGSKKKQAKLFNSRSFKKLLPKNYKPPQTVKKHILNQKHWKQTYGFA